jgi:hypothetical protein
MENAEHNQHHNNFTCQEIPEQEVFNSLPVLRGLSENLSPAHTFSHRDLPMTSF